MTITTVGYDLSPKTLLGKLIGESEIYIETEKKKERAREKDTGKTIYQFYHRRLLCVVRGVHPDPAHTYRR